MHPHGTEAIHVPITQHTNGMGIDMHTEQDRATYWQTLSRLTGHTVRYLKLRAWVRATVVAVPLASLFTYALTK